MNGRAYLSIGQVLDLLKQEFPDLTISKIRFLESQGLLDPERTPSGYRKFYEPDIDRLRFILHAQQDQYLPLKVIKGRLGMEDEGDAGEGGEGGGAESGGEGGGAGDHVPAPVPAGSMIGGPVAIGPASHAARLPAPSPDSGAPGGPGRGVPAPAGAGAASARLELVTGPVAALGDPVSLTVEELMTASGLSAAEVADLERFGLLTGQRLAGTTYYDADCLEVARVAAGFRAFGVEARHLRMYRTAVEREAGFFEQVVTPMLKQRNPQARRQAVDTLHELSRLGNAMRAAVLRQALRDYTGGTSPPA